LDQNKTKLSGINSLHKQCQIGVILENTFSTCMFHIASSIIHNNLDVYIVVNNKLSLIIHSTNRRNESSKERTIKHGIVRTIF